MSIPSCVRMHLNDASRNGSSQQCIPKWFMVFFVLLHIIITTHAAPVVDVQSLTQRRYPNMRQQALSGSGIALAEPISGTFLNPALIHTWHWNTSSVYGMEGIYENDSLFSSLIASIGMSWYIDKKSTIGVVYRTLQNPHINNEHDITLSLSGRLFDQSIDQGAVNMGANIRFESLSWSLIRLDSLHISTIVFDAAGNQIQDSTSTKKYLPLYSQNQRLYEKRLLADIGFYQDRVIEHIDFGLTFHNIFGYIWAKQQPRVATIHDTLWNTNTIKKIKKITDSSYYDSAFFISNKTNNSFYKRMTIGIAWNLFPSGVPITGKLPFDLEFFRLFEKNRKTLIGIHTGIEVWLYDQRIALRFGYAHAPAYVYILNQSYTIQNTSAFSGGMSTSFERVSVSASWQKNSWGLAMTWRFSTITKIAPFENNP